LINEKVSVIIPIYNSEKFLSEAIESVLNQSYTDLEIIVIDDGSTDDSLKILEKYSDKITILSQTNEGLASALNLGIKKMNGHWFKWFSPDDILYPEAIEILVNEVTILPKNTIVYSNWELIDEKNNELRSFSESNYNKLGNFEFNVRLLDGQQINVNTTLIPSNLFREDCIFRTLDDTTAIDYDFFLRAGILHGINFYLIEKTLLKYRVHSQQLSHKGIAKTLSYLSEVRNQVLSQTDESTRKKYLNSLDEYKKKKSFSAKTKEIGLKFVTSALPSEISDSLLVFYLNKIRRSR